MIEVKIFKGTDDKVKSLEVSGHAEYADYGKDIICAGVSALIETCILGLEKVAEIKPLVIKRAGYFSLKLPKDARDDLMERAYIIVDTTLLGLEDMSRSYPNYIRVETKKEVP